jgi:DNA-directed RNA polymerase subunit RPC12/RpoP
MDLSEAIDQFIEENNLYRLEGRQGVENLAKVVNVLGYEDFQHYGQLRGGASLGDIFEFLGDNPGCIEAMIEWIKQQRGGEWLEKVKEVITVAPLAAAQYPGGVCPDCGEEINPEATVGEECDNCGHVFVLEAPTDDADGQVA